MTIHRRPGDGYGRYFLTIAALMVFVVVTVATDYYGLAP